MGGKVTCSEIHTVKETQTQKVLLKCMNICWKIIFSSYIWSANIYKLNKKISAQKRNENTIFVDLNI